MVNPKDFRKAVREPALRASYVAQFEAVKPPYVNVVEYTPPVDFKALEQRFGVAPAHGSIAKTYALDLEGLTNGSHSEIYICDPFFDMLQGNHLNYWILMV